jgi:hypothetical protein
MGKNDQRFEGKKKMSKDKELEKIDEKINKGEKISKEELEYLTDVLVDEWDEQQKKHPEIVWNIFCETEREEKDG